MFNYLQSRNYYYDLYDLQTIKECLREVKFWRKTAKEKSNDEKIKKLPVDEKKKGFAYFSNWHLMVVKGENYRRKKETIEKWMDEARIKQEKYDNTLQPGDIRCPKCHNLMKCFFKHLEDYLDKPMRMIFFFKCTKCDSRRGIYEKRKSIKIIHTYCLICLI